jgi:hypothetical protein
MRNRPAEMRARGQPLCIADQMLAARKAMHAIRRMGFIVIPLSWGYYCACHATCVDAVPYVTVCVGLDEARVLLRGPSAGDLLGLRC